MRAAPSYGCCLDLCYNLVTSPCSSTIPVINVADVRRFLYASTMILQRMTTHPQPTHICARHWTTAPCYQHTYQHQRLQCSVNMHCELARVMYTSRVHIFGSHSENGSSDKLYRVCWRECLNSRETPSMLYVLTMRHRGNTALPISSISIVRPV